MSLTWDGNGSQDEIIELSSTDKQTSEQDESLGWLLRLETIDISWRERDGEQEEDDLEEVIAQVEEIGEDHGVREDLANLANLADRWGMGDQKPIGFHFIGYLWIINLYK